MRIFSDILIQKEYGLSNPANVQDLDDKITRHARDAHKIISADNKMWMKIHKTDKSILLFFLHCIIPVRISKNEIHTK
jgi:hypothetical protein